MGLKKQEFYEGAALHVLARAGNITAIRYEPPFFVLNEQWLALLKYCTKKRSPWSFTFTADEQAILDQRASEAKIVIGLICGADGVAAISYDAYRNVTPIRSSPVHIACYRRHREHYEVSGPDGTLLQKVAPANWRRTLSPRGLHETS